MFKLFGWPAALVTVLATPAASPLRAEIIEQVLVKVNGEILSLSDWEKRQFAVLRGRPDLAKVQPGDPALARAITEITPSLILSVVDELLWTQRGRERGLALTKERYAEVVADIKKSQPDIVDDAAFKRALEAEGMTEDDLFRDIERGMLIRYVQQEDVLNRITVTEEEIRTYFQHNQSEFTTPAEITLREIMIAVPRSDKGVNVAQDDEARARAGEVRKRLMAGEPFPRLAMELSDAGSKANGGLLSPLRLADLDARLQKVIAPLTVGEMTDVFQSTSGYHIFRLETRSETKSRGLEDVRADVSRRVADAKSQGEMIRYLEKLRAQAQITWRHDELQRLYEQALSERLTKAGISSPAR